MEFCFSQNTFFPNTYQGIRSIRSPAKVGLVITKLLTTSPVVSWRGWEKTPPPSPQHHGSTVILCLTSSGGQRSRRWGQPTYSLVSIRKNVFWLKQNSICSDRILTFGIRSRFNLSRDGDLVWLTRVLYQEPRSIVAEDASQGSPRLSSVSPGHDDARS